MLFELGQIVMTRAVVETIKEHPEFQKEIDKAMERYTKGDWGEMEKSDASLNDYAVVNKQDRVFAAYMTSHGKVWIITEADSSTCILFPDDY
jgi:hypothetical protein